MWNPFRPKPPPPRAIVVADANGLLPNGRQILDAEFEEEQAERAVYRGDRWVNGLTGIGSGLDKTAHGRFFPVNRVLDQELTSLFNGSDMARKIVEKRPKEMLRRGYEIESSDVKAVKATQVDELRDYATDTLGLEEEFREGLTWGRLYGGFLLVMNIDDGRAPWEPVDENNIKSFNGLAPVDRRYAYVQSQYSDISPDAPASARFGRPEIYLISNAIASSGWTSFGEVRKKSPEEIRKGERNALIQLVHETRVIRFDGNAADIVTRQQLAGWTWSVLQVVYDAMRQFEHSFDSAGYLLSDASQGVFKLQGLIKAIAAGQRQAVADRMMMMEMSRSVARGLILDAGTGDGKNAEDFHREPTSFAGVPDLLDKMMLRLSAAADMPATELFGRAPAGMNATGESDTRKWYDTIATEQENMLGPQLKRVFRLLALAKKGPLRGKDVKWKIRFKPLWSPTDGELATTRLANAQRDVAYITAGVVKPEEVAVELDDVYPNLDIEAREEVLAAGLKFDPYENEPAATSAAAVNSAGTGEPMSPIAPAPIVGGGGSSNAPEAQNKGGKPPPQAAGPTAKGPVSPGAKPGMRPPPPAKGANGAPAKPAAVKLPAIHIHLPPGAGGATAATQAPTGASLPAAPARGKAPPPKKKPATTDAEDARYSSHSPPPQKRWSKGYELQELARHEGQRMADEASAKANAASADLMSAKVEQSPANEDAAAALHDKAAGLQLRAGNSGASARHKELRDLHENHGSGAAERASKVAAEAKTTFAHKEAGEKHLEAAARYPKGAPERAEHLERAAEHAEAAGGRWDEGKHPRDEHGKFSSDSTFAPETLTPATAANPGSVLARRGVAHELRPAAFVVVKNEKGEILTVSRPDPPHEPSLPGGMVELGETSSEAAAREVLEETGVSVSGLELVTMALSPTDGRQVRIYSASSYTGEPATPRESPDEGDKKARVAWMSLSKLQLNAERYRSIITTLSRLGALGGPVPTEPPPPGPARGSPGDNGTASSTTHRDAPSAAPVEPKPSKVTAMKVFTQATEDYPEDAAEWMLDYKWAGPLEVPLDELDYSNSKSWRAAKEPASVAFHTIKIHEGQRKPIILVRTPGSDKYIIVDGHHRALAYLHLDQPALAYVADVDSKRGMWDAMHDSQSGSSQQGSRQKRDACEVERHDSLVANFVTRAVLERTAAWLQDFNPDQDRDAHGMWTSQGGRPNPETQGATPIRRWTNKLPEGLQKHTWMGHFDKSPEEGGKPSAERIQSVHKAIIEKALDVPVPPAGEQKIAIMTMGAAASGKSSALRGIDKSRFVVMDPDDVKKQLPEYDQAVNGGPKTYRDAAAMSHEESSYVAKQILNEAIARGNHIIVDGTGSDAKSFLRKAEKLKAAGYTVHVAMSHLDEKEGMGRMFKRAEESGRLVKVNIARKGYHDVPRNFEQIVRSPHVDSFKMVHNNVPGGTLVWQGSKEHGDQILDPAFVKGFRAKYGGKKDSLALDFNADQPRDERGRFGEGGGGSSGSAPKAEVASNTARFQRAERAEGVLHSAESAREAAETMAHTLPGVTVEQMERTFSAGPFVAKLSGVSAPTSSFDGYSKTTLRFSLEDKDGNHVGDSQRTFVRENDKTRATLDELFLDDAAQGKGYGRAQFANVIRDYPSMGVRDLSVHATEKGVYVWAGMGFNWGDTGSRYMGPGLAEHIATKYGVPKNEALAAIRSTDKPWEFAKLTFRGDPVAKEWMLSSKGREPWKGGEWFGTMKLVDGDPGYEHAKKVLAR